MRKDFVMKRMASYLALETSLIVLFIVALTQIQLLENDTKTKETQIATMEAALDKSKEESSSLGHELSKLF